MSCDKHLSDGVIMIDSLLLVSVTCFFMSFNLCGDLNTELKNAGTMGKLF